MDATSRLVNAAVSRIATGVLNEGSVEDLAASLGVTDRHLRRVLVEALGVSPVELAQTARLALAKRLLHDSSLGLAELAFASGFQSVRRFNSAFDARFHRSPTSVRREAQEDGSAGIRLRLDYRPPFSWPSALRFFAARAMHARQNLTVLFILELSFRTPTKDSLPSLPMLRARREPGLENLFRALIVERIGAVVRASTEPKSLQALLSFAGPEAHQRLVASLRSVEHPELAAQLARAVMQGSLREVIEHVGRMTPAAVGGLVRAGSALNLADVRPLLVLCLNHADAGARLAAVDALDPSHALQLIVEVRKRLTDKDSAVRQRVALLLGAIEDRASVPALAAGLSRAELAAERGVLATALAEIRSDEAANAVRSQFLTEKDLAARCVMAEALGQLGDRDSLELLARETGRLLAPADLKAVGRRYLRR